MEYEGERHGGPLTSYTEILHRSWQVPDRSACPLILWDDARLGHSIPLPPLMAGLMHPIVHQAWGTKSLSELMMHHDVLDSDKEP